MAELRWVYYPVAGMPGNITGNFGDNYGGYLHRGTDVGVNTGTPVVAPASGRSVQMLNDGSFGIAVCIEHPGTGWYSLYAHLSAAHVVVGQNVYAGEIIGVSGNTGQSSGAHLHWQVCNSPNFPVDINASRDAMQVPFETEALPPPVEEVDTMTPEQEKLLLLVASVVGGWSTGAQFQSVEEALPSLEHFEVADQRILIGMDALGRTIEDVANALLIHLTEQGGGESPDAFVLRSAISTLRSLRPAAV